MATGAKTGGRKAGVLNKSTAEIKELARHYAPQVIARLAHLALNAESETAQIAAGRELLDRGFGKATQPVSGGADGENPILHRIERVIIDPKN